MEKWHPLETLHSNIYQRNEQSIDSAWTYIQFGVMFKVIIII